MKNGQKQKVVLLNYEYPPLGGGGGHASQIIAEGLAKKGHEVLVLTSAFKGLAKTEVQNGVTIKRLPTWRQFKEKCRVYEMLIFILSALVFGTFHCLRFKPKRVLCFFSIPCGPVALFWKVLLQIPYVVALRGGDVPGFLPEQLSRFHTATNWLTRLIWQKAQAVTANSFGLASLAQKFMPNLKFPVIPNGVNQKFYFDRSQQTPAKLQLLTVGRLSEQKKIHRLIEAMARVKPQILKSIELNIVGDGPLRTDLEALVQQKSLQASVVFQGWVDRSHIMRHYQQADVFVLASDFEGMPNVMLEAMASSLALVAVKAPGVEELIEPGVNGYLIEKEHLQDFENHWMKLLESSDLLGRMQRESYKKALGMTWDKVVDGFDELVFGG